MTENFQHTDTVAPKDNQIAPYKLSTEISDIVKDHPTLALVTAATTGAGSVMATCNWRKICLRKRLTTKRTKEISGSLNFE